MDTRYLMDTNVIIHFLGGMFNEAANDWLEEVIEDNLVDISVINQIEVLGYNGESNEMNILKEFIDVLNILPLSENIISKTIELRQLHKIKLPDAIIAATALEGNLTIITQNIKDFRNIPNIRIINAYDK